MLHLTNKKYKNKQMKSKINAVQLFHESFGLGVSQEMRADLGRTKNQLRFNLMDEENKEYLEAVTNNDLVEVADALGDMLYILCGTILEHGMQHKIEEVFNEIQRSNMSKLGEDGKPIYREDGKVLKGPNYFKPDIASILDK
jgi:predicted HAD superfamily Cof-like phosphohydrolase